MPKPKIIAVYIVMFFFVLIALIPIIPGIMMSFKSFSEIFNFPPTLLPENPSIEGFLRLFGLAEEPILPGAYMPTRKSDFIIFFMNTTIVSVITSFLVIIISTPAAYSLARFKFRGKTVFGVLVLILHMIPSYVVLIPFFILFSKLRLINTLYGLIILYLSFRIPLGIWFLRGYFATMPWELEEAALLDGCTRLGALRRIIVPLAMPAIIGVFLLTFVACWGEFLYAMVFSGSISSRTLSMGLKQFIAEYHIDWPAVMGGSIIFSIPVALIFFATQRYFRAGLAAGAVKR